jgi:hypothetical protein
MAIPNMSDVQMRAALKELEQAAYNHEQWSEMLFGNLICRLTPDRRDISGDAHRHCRFGQWYYNSGFAALEGHPGFSEIAVEHEHMHQFAASLLRSSIEGAPISTNEYDRFVNALKRMRLELATIQQEGGEEFLICLPGDLQAGRDIIERIREGLGSLQHEPAGEQTFHVTASFGLAPLDPDIPAEQCIDRADKALYAAKAGGRNRTITWDAAMNDFPAEFQAAV